MQCFVTADLNAHLNKLDELERREIYIDSLAKKESAEMLRSDPEKIRFQAVMEYISVNECFINDLDKCIHAVINNVTNDSDNSVKALKMFMQKMAYKAAKEAIEMESK